MAMETLISLQCEGLRSIGEPSAPRPSGVQQGSLLVVVDANKAVAPQAVHWALGNVVRKGDHLKILGIITHIPNPMGFMVRVDQSTRSNPNIMELQFEIATKKEAIWRTAYLKEWCEKAGVKLEVDVKAGNNPKVIATDEAKAMSAYHVILDKYLPKILNELVPGKLTTTGHLHRVSMWDRNMKKDRKYFVDNLSCFVSRIRSSGGVDSLRSFHVAMSNKLPPMAPTTPKKTTANNMNTESAAGHQSKASMASTASSSSSYRGGSSMSSMSFELGGESSDDFSDPVSIPSLDSSIDAPVPVPQLTIRINPQPPNQLFNLLRGAGGPLLQHQHQPRLDGENNNNGFSNPLRKSAAPRNWLRNEETVDQCREIHEQQQQQQADRPLTPRTEFRFEQGPVQHRLHHQQRQVNGWIGQLNVAPEFAKGSSKVNMQGPMQGRPALTATLHTQGSFNVNSSGRRTGQTTFCNFKADCKLTMDLHWPLMHWADCRAMTLRGSLRSASAGSATRLSSSATNLRARRRLPVSGLNYSDMVDSD